MEILKELVNIITKYKIRSIDIIGDENVSNKSTRVNTFYDHILKGNFSSDDEAACHFFNADKKNPNYRKLKNNLKRRLINSAFFIDTSLPSFNESQKAYYNCCRDWAAVNILLGRSARRSAIELAEKVLKQALKYEFSVIVVDITKTLRGHYGGFVKDKAKYTKYRDLFSEYLKIWNAEMEAETLYTDLITNFVHSISSKPFIHETANDYLKQLEPYCEQFSTYRLHMFRYLIEVIKHTSINDYKNTSDACKRAIIFFESKSYLAKKPLALFLHQKIVCHIQLKEYEAGNAAAKRSISLLDEGTYKWYKQQELRILLAFHTKRYLEAYNIFQLARTHKNFKLLFNNQSEVWILYDAYLHYLISTNTIRFGAKERAEMANFRLGKFLNEVPIYSKDKRGMNIPIMVVQILFMIQKKKYGDAVDRIEAIEKYCSRHLRKDENYRSNCFIKMLVLIPKASFHKTAVQRKADKYFKKLLDVPLEVSAQSFEIEIIPYEYLWEYIIASLDNRFH